METIIEWEKIDFYKLLKVSSHSSQIFDVLGGHSAYGTHTSAPTEGTVLVTPVFHFNRGGAKEEVTETCRKYLNYLQRFVKAFEQAHKQAESS